MFFETQEERDKIIKDPTFLLVISLIKDFFKEVRRYLFILPIFVLFGYIYIYRNAKTLKPTYTSDITFIITQQDKTKSNVLEDLGLSSRGNKVSINFDKLKMYGYSKKIITGALFKKMDFGKEDLSVNHYMRLMGYPQPQPYFQPVADIDSLPQEKIALLNGIISAMRAGVISMSVGAGDVFMISVKSHNELFAHRFSKVYYETLKEFYIETALGSYYSSYSYFKNRMDSLNAALSGVEYAIANIEDRGHNVIKSVANVPKIDLERKRAVLFSNYSEALKQFELAKVNFENSAPIFIVMDSPNLPLPSDAPTARKQYIMATAGAVFLYLVIVVISILWKYFGFIVKAVIKN